jgi:hypothetical protein
MAVNHTNTSPQERGPRAIFSLSTAALTVTNIPAALTDLSAAIRPVVDLRPFTKVRLSANVTTATAVGTPELRLQYSLDNSTFAYFDATESGPAVSTVGTGVKSSEWETIPEAARKANITLRAVTIGGDAAEDPILGTITVELA